MLCTPVFIFTSGSSALLGCPRCGLSIWLSLLAIFNTLFGVYANLFHEKMDKTRKYLKSIIFMWYKNGRLVTQSINTVPNNHRIAVCVYVYACVSVCVHVYVCMSVHVCVHACICACMLCVCVCVCVSVRAVVVVCISLKGRQLSSNHSLTQHFFHMVKTAHEQ